MTDKHDTDEENGHRSRSYWAFISYSSKDRGIAKWLHRRIENYPIPKEFQTIRFEDGTALGKHLRPVFRDRDELTGAAELGPAISQALEKSRYLIVLCSRNSARSQWVNQEILEFQAAGKSGSILALILDGEPNATSNPSMADDEECFPPALRYPCEPLAGDLRKSGDGRERGFLKVLAGMAQLDFDGLYRRHERSKRRRQLVFSAVSIVVILALAGLSTFALLQRDRAEREKERAVKNEREARHQRDLARSNLATFYQEKAHIAVEDSATSLAWALKAAETNPQLLDSMSFQGQLAKWSGPFPMPDRCDPTGFKPSTSFSLHQTHYLSRHHRRIILRGTNSSWSLLGWDGEAPLTKGLTTAPIRQFVSPEKSPWFAFVGFRFVEIRAWDDGRLIASHQYEDLEIDSASATAGELLLAVSQQIEGDAQSAIQSWDPLQQEKPVPTDMVWHGVIQIIEAVSDEDTSRLVAYLPEDEQRGFGYWKRNIPDGKWQIAMASDTIPINNAFSLAGHDLPPGVVGWREEDQSLRFTDFITETRYHIELNEGEVFFHLRRTPYAVEAIIKKSEGNTYEARNLADGSITPLFGGREIDNLTLEQETGKLAAWDREASSLIISNPSQDDRVYPVRLPGGLSFQCMTIHLVSDRMVLIEGYGWPSNHGVVALIDCEAAEAEGVYLLRVPQVRNWLEASINTDGKAAIKVLSHQLAAISSASAIAPIAEVIRKNGESTHPGEGKPLHLQIGNDGAFDTLLQKSDDQNSWVARAKNGSDIQWFPLEDHNRSYDSVVALGENILMNNFGNSMLVDASGNTRWKSSRDGTFKLKTFSHGGRHLLIRSGSQGVQLADAESNTMIWSNPLEDMAEAIEVMPEMDRILIATASRQFDESPATVTLREWGIKDGAESRVWTLKLEKLKPYGTEIEILGSSSPMLLIDQRSDGDIHDCVIYQCDGDSLVERMRWQRPAHVKSIKLPNGKGFVVDMSDPDNHNHQAALVTVANGELSSVPIPLPGALQSIHPAPKGDLCLFVLDDSMFLYDFSTSRALGGSLMLGRDTYGQEIRPDDHYRPLWSDDAEFLYLTSRHVIYQLNGKNGEIIGTRREHQPDSDSNRNTYEIMHTALSPDGGWLASADASGTTRISRVNAERFDLDSLREFTRKAGGWHITAEDELLPWNP